jgi:hypothetical protein
LDFAADRSLATYFAEKIPDGDQSLVNLMAVALLMSSVGETGQRKNPGSRKVRLPGLHE